MIRKGGSRYAPADGGIFLKFYRGVNREALHSTNFGRKRGGETGKQVLICRIM